MKPSCFKKFATWLLAGLILSSPLAMESCSKDDDDNGTTNTPSNTNPSNNDGDGDNTETNPGDPDNHSAAKGQYDIAFKGEYERSFQGKATIEDSIFYQNPDYNEAEDESALLTLDLEGDSSQLTVQMARHEENTLQGEYDIITNLVQEQALKTGATLQAGIETGTITLSSETTGSFEITDAGANYVKGYFEGVKVTGASVSSGTFTSWLNGKFNAKRK